MEEYFVCLDGIQYPDLLFIFITFIAASVDHNNDVLMSAMSSQITGDSIIIHAFAQPQFEENIKASRHWALCAGNSLVTSEFPAQRASNAENISIWWRHHVKLC